MMQNLSKSKMSLCRSPAFWQVSFLFLSYFSVNFSESASQTSWILIGSVVGLRSITSRCSGNEPVRESSGNRAQARPQGLLVFLPTPYLKTRRPWGRGWNRAYSGVWKPWKLPKLIEHRGSKRQHLFLSLFQLRPSQARGRIISLCWVYPSLFTRSRDKAKQLTKTLILVYIAK